MPNLKLLTGEVVDYGDIGMPAVMVPSVRRAIAEKRGVLENALIITPQSLGDVVCAIPAIRYAMKLYEQVSVATFYPELFEDMGLLKVYDLKQNPEIKFEEYFVLRCYYDGEDLNSEFITNFNTQIVDYLSIGIFKNQLPVEDRAIWLGRLNGMVPKKNIIVHPGSSWPSKTFPKAWWDQVLAGIIEKGIKPTIIGGTTHDGRSTVDVCTVGCEDLRGKLSIMESADLLRAAHVVITNDSAPLHIASAGTAWIGFLSTVKHPDAITHWRRACDRDQEPVLWGWRMENLSTGWIYRQEFMNPSHQFVTRFDLATPEELESRLPDPSFVAHWAVEKLQF